MTRHECFGRRRMSRTLGAAAALLIALLSSCDTLLDPRMDIIPSQAVVEFRAVRGSTTPVTQIITVTNSGGGRLGPVSCPAEPAPWLSCSVAQGNAVTFTADPTGLTADPARVAVTLTAPGASASVEVSLVLEQPVLTVSSATLTFTATEGAEVTTPASAQVTVTNTGAGGLAALGTITCAPDPSAPQVTCAVNQSTGVLTVTVNPVGVAQGTHVYPLVVDSEHNEVAQTVSVTLTLSLLPRLGLSRQALHFEAIRGSEVTWQQTVSVSNVGGGELAPVTCPPEPAPWLTCAVSGTTVTFTANPAGLTASPVPVSVNISSANAVNSPQAVTVSFAIAQPVLRLSKSALTFRATENDTTAVPAQDTVLVTNAGAGTLGNLGAITCSPPEDEPVMCAVIPATGVLTVEVDPIDLSPGVYVYLVEVSAAHSDASQVITVTLTVVAPPTMVLDPSTLHFRAIRGTTVSLVDSVAISNAGGGSLGEITCPAEPAAWLTCAVRDTTQLTITADPTGLLSSPLQVNILVAATEARNSPVSLPVTFTIQQPVLAVSVPQVSFTAAVGASVTDPTSHVVLVTNANEDAGTLANLGMISCTVADPASCAVNQATGELTLTVDPSTLDAGRYVWFATVTAEHASNDSVTITVVLDVS